VGAYRRAHGSRLVLDLPAWLGLPLIQTLRLLLRTLHWLTGAVLFLGLEYLLAVAACEHTFDNRKFQQAFRGVRAAEKSLCHAFGRIRRRHGGERNAAVMR